MHPDDQSVTAPRVDGSAVPFGSPEAGEAAKEATLVRLRALSPESDPDAPSRAGLRSVDDELARLVYDSALDAQLWTTVRAREGSSRQLSFEARGVTLEMELGAGRLVGQLVPPQQGAVELRHRDGTTELETDELGCFHVSCMPEGPVSFRFRPSEPTAQSIATSWITL